MISVIVPVYNVEKYLPRCLQAISGQSYRDLEILLVDDGSTDGSGKLCDEFAASDPRAKVIHQQNAGLWAARNAGQDAAHGDFLFFPDADDYFHQDTLQILFDAINSGETYDLAICRMQRTERTVKETDLPVQVRTTEVSKDDLFRDLFQHEPEDPFAVFMWNKLFRSSLIRELRTEPYPRSQDKDYMIRLFFKLDKAILIENHLYCWVKRPGSLTQEKAAWYWFHQSRARICYSNLMNLPEEGKHYSHYLLDEFYVRLLFWVGKAYEKPERAAVIFDCKTMVDNTRGWYLHCREIPLWKRVACLFLINHPWFTCQLLRISRN